MSRFDRFLATVFGGLIFLSIVFVAAQFYLLTEKTARHQVKLEESIIKTLEAGRAVYLDNLNLDRQLQAKDADLQKAAQTITYLTDSLESLRGSLTEYEQCFDGDFLVPSQQGLMRVFGLRICGYNLSIEKMEETEQPSTP